MAAVTWPSAILVSCSAQKKLAKGALTLGLCRLGVERSLPRLAALSLPQGPCKLQRPVGLPFLNLSITHRESKPPKTETILSG
jgi:hypothetical protein